MTPCIQFSFAHPDDESFSGCAGTAMNLRRRLCARCWSPATRGERGKAGDPPVCTVELWRVPRA
jgi:LmbE family N-acetylglucosaminyl deacetylase